MTGRPRLPTIALLLTLVGAGGCATATGAPSMTGLENMSCAELNAKMREIDDWERRVRAGGNVSQVLTGSGATTTREISRSARIMRQTVRDAQIAGGC